MAMARDNAAVPSMEITDWGGPIRESLLQILDEGDKANGDALGEEITEGAQSNLKEISTKGKKISGSTILRGPILEVYALNSLEGRMELWRELTDIATGVVELWAVMGDFNTGWLTENGEGNFTLGIITKVVLAESAANWTESLLIMLGWTSCISRKLTSFGLEYLTTARNSGPKPFRFFDAWTHHKDYDEVVKRGWLKVVNVNSNPILRFVTKLKNVKSELKCWNKEGIGEVFKNVKDAELDLGRIQHHLSLDPLDDSLAILEKEAKGKLWAALQMEERFLKEKSRVRWLELGDGNNNFFHKSMQSRHNRNHILEVMDQTGNTLTNPKAIKEEAVLFYKKLFGSDYTDLGSCPPSIPLSGVVSESQNLELGKEVNGEEVKRVVFSLKDSKAPGPDGFGAGFYKHSWVIIGEELTNAVQLFFTNSFMPHSINATFINLVPKSGDVSTFAGFRPIALCNLLYKIITKILSNRIQHVIGSVVSHNQSAFIKGRPIVDNILVCHDIVRGIEQKAASPTAVLKVDLHKAYESLSRKFLFDVMGRMGFSDKFIGWVKACVTTPMFSVLINGSPVGFFGGGRGIRQGDPLSPYLFTLAMEAFSGIMRRLEIDGQIKLLPRCKSFHLSHLIFADDLMIFVKGNCDSISASLGGLDEFAALFGLQLNKSKSSIILGGLIQASSLELLDLTGFSKTKLPIRYLRVPLVFGRLSMKDCSPILDLVRQKLEGWKTRFLSYAGRLQLFSSVLQGSYIYWAGIFGLPGNVITKLESMFSNFLWSGPSLERKTHFISWDAQDRLWVNWVQQRYLKQESLWTVKGLNNCSWVWRKVLKYRDKALPFIKTIIGDGSATKLWLDNWHPFGVLLSRFGNRICYDAGSYSLAARHACVKEIIRDGDWHPGPSTSFDLIDIWRALPAIEKFHDEVPDLTVWTGNSSGNFSSKSAWNAIRTRAARIDWSEAVWFEGSIKSHSFIAWRCLSDALPTRDNLIHRHIPTPHHCVFCWVGTERRNHLFFGCPFTNDIWKNIYDFCFHDGATPSNAIDAAISVRYVAGRAGKLGLVIKLAFCATIKHIWSERNQI
ncbi:uncharacterized protein LOC122668529 [Telopea speciosissima]|uniref:uncharacterized protein LOC122668529 n=1 Tax=Telopea speciosissima TaxID=54955 RepID=UPI001CC7FB7D|nr:uncharacterized protein LOC122668529 [Telopea speciosissima]